MDVNWIELSVFGILAILLVIYLIRRNLKDKKEVTKFFIGENKSKKEIELDDDDDEVK